jgi:predicted  nucleic acid-binding Zn-ribbon protein
MLELQISILKQQITAVAEAVAAVAAKDVDLSDLEKQISDLETQLAAIASKDVDLSSLEQKIAALQEQLEAASSSNGEGLEELKELLEAQIAVLKKEIEGVADAVASKVDLSGLETQLAALQAQIQELKSSIPEATDLSGLETQLAALQQQLASAASSNEDELAALKQQIAKLGEKLDGVAAAAATKEDIAALGVKLAELEGQIAAVATKADATALEGKLEDLDAQIKEIASKEIKEVDLSPIEEKLEALKQQINALSNPKVECSLETTEGTRNVAIAAPAVTCNGAAIAEGSLSWAPTDLTPKASGKIAIVVSVSGGLCAGVTAVCGIIEVAEPVLECGAISATGEKGVALDAPEVTCDGKVIGYGLEWSLPGLTPVAGGATEVTVKATKGVCKDKIASCGTVTVPSELACVLPDATGIKGVAITAPVVTCDGANVAASGITWTPANLVPVDAGSVEVSATVGSGACSGQTKVCGTVTVSEPGLTYGTRFDPIKLGLAPGATTASVNLNWWSRTASADHGTQSLVRVLDASGNTLVETFTGNIETSTTAPNFVPKADTVRHYATITGLSPNTSYKYAVSNNGTDWSNLYDYKTPPAGNVFKFAAISDIQIPYSSSERTRTGNNWKSTAQRVVAAEASFILSTGDQVDGTQGGTTGSMGYSADEYNTLFAPPEMRNIPLAPVMGNHDMHCPYYTHYNMPNLSRPSTCSGSYTTGVPSGSYTGGNYYYLYNNILFVALNTAPYPTSKTAAQPHVNAFREAIQSAKSTYSGQYDWIIVQHHKSTASVASHTGDTDIQYYVEAGFETLMCEEGVDLVIGGHDHIYVRSRLMTCDEEFLATKNSARVGKGFSVRSEDVNDETKGTMYMTITSASAMKVYSAWTSGSNANYPLLADYSVGAATITSQGSSNANKRPLSYFWHSNSLTADLGEYTIFEVNGASMTVTTRLTGTNAQTDQFTMTPKGR